MTEDQHPATWTGHDGTVYDLTAPLIDRYDDHWHLAGWIHPTDDTDPLPLLSAYSAPGAWITDVLTPLPLVITDYGPLKAQPQHTDHTQTPHDGPHGHTDGRTPMIGQSETHTSSNEPQRAAGDVPPPSGCTAEVSDHTCTCLTDQARQQ